MNMYHEKILVASLRAQEPDLYLNVALVLIVTITFRNFFTPKCRKPET